MMMRKACPRCRGDLFLDRNDGPAMLSCLQCGRSFAPPAVVTEELQLPVSIAAKRGQAA